MRPRRSLTGAILLTSLAMVGCTDGDPAVDPSSTTSTGDGVRADVLGAAVTPTELVAGELFSLTFPGDRVIGPDFVLARDDEPIYVLGAADEGREHTISPISDGLVAQRPAQLVPDASGEIVVELRLPDDAQVGDVLCIDFDTECEALPIAPP